MASVTFENGTFNLASNLASAVQLALASETEVTRRPAETRRYAGGRLRVITRPGAQRQLELSFRLVPLADVQTLEGWVGKTVMWRDPRGRKVWGVYDQIDVTELAGLTASLVNATLSLSEVTESEEV